MKSNVELALKLTLSSVLKLRTCNKFGGCGVGSGVGSGVRLEVGLDAEEMQ